jgi:hypothetical protein
MCLNVVAARPVTSFASCVGRLFLAAGDALEMGVFIEFEPNVRMADLAGGAPHICVGLSLCIGG